LEFLRGWCYRIKIKENLRNALRNIRRIQKSVKNYVLVRRLQKELVFRIFNRERLRMITTINKDMKKFTIVVAILARMNEEILGRTIDRFFKKCQED
jgi:hypothetical protein